DSRVLLACMCHLGRRPSAASMGSPHATDVRIATQLARITGLDFTRVEIEPEDYIAVAEQVLHTTSGEKIFWHWHTGIYTDKVGFAPDGIHLVGSNGEFARSYFFDKGFA